MPLIVGDAVIGFVVGEIAGATTGLEVGLYVGNSCPEGIELGIVLCEGFLVGPLDVGSVVC